MFHNCRATRVGDVRELDELEKPQDPNLRGANANTYDAPIPIADLHGYLDIVLLLIDALTQRPQRKIRLTAGLLKL